jgi:hypothetical protein
MIDGSERLRTNNFGIAVTSPAPQVGPSRYQLAQRIAGADAKSGWFRQHRGARHASAAAGGRGLRAVGRGGLATVS